MSKVLEKWEELKVLVESLELDVHKNARGNKSAGTRARKGLRLLRTQLLTWSRLHLKLAKTNKL